MTPPTACPYTFAIVARHLDGDVAAADAVAPSWEPGDFLAEHLQQCAQCRRELQRSRRLDAALAEASGRATGDLEADPARLRQLLGRAVALAEATPAATTAAASARAQPRRLPLQWLCALLLLALGFMLCLWLLPRASGAGGTDADRASPAPASPPVRDPDAPDLMLAGPAAPPALAPALPQALASTAIPLGTNVPPTPVAATSFAVPRTRVDAQNLADVLADRALADRLQLTASLQFAACGGRSPVAVARAAAAALRLRSSQLLLETPVPFAFDAWCRATAGLDAGADLDQVLADARRRPAVAAQLGQRLLALGQGRARGLGDLAALTVAARLGGRELDAALRQLVRRADVQQELTAALRSQPVRDGRALLLLDIWGDLVARGRNDDEELARALFLGQPAACARELQQELQQCRQSPRRIRCLLALGVVGGPQVRDTLVAALRGPVQPEAHAAAFALAQLAPVQLRDLLPEATRDRCLLRAALCRAGLPEALEWLRGLDLTPAERALLADGECTLAQFPVLAALLHDRGPSTF